MSEYRKEPMENIHSLHEPYNPTPRQFLEALRSKNMERFINTLLKGCIGPELLSIHVDEGLNK
jgi:hypothetical protein